ncbi:MAG: N-acetylglutaminylglutamine synthetase [Aromatoleum sp.]|jgi:GNAT-family acetyltransferase (TIGR03103 family)|uniref:N-acetylglutaminylglutamine synthetase n=1 Tax=Aromatoleum sp. TaxID=2307007 RepID=UPI002893C152|nr:N-acetylglutaminylglutamine synthetase [Aromatoleum sp.]MDT3670398.1 N-acetylglutaminylglutamine synthetase [Aromatoleum sp.]
MNATHERNPLDPQDMMSLRHWEDPTGDPDLEAADNDSMVDCGWGRLIFGQTFADPHTLADAICHEQPGKRDIALYLRDPQVVVSLAPQDLFIDPSYTYRLALSRAPGPADAGWNIRRARVQDAEAIRRIYQTRQMVPPPKSFFATVEDRDEIDVLVAEDSSGIIGVVTGIDHVRAFNDPDGGASLWALAADSQSCHQGVGAGLTRALADLFRARGRTFLDLSVVHDNAQAIALYEKLGFVRVPVYCVKKKNPINEPLFLGPNGAADLNIYAGILVREARRRGIGVEVLDADNGYFRLTLGGRSITCRESLSELTSAIAMSRCDDKSLTLRVLAAAGLSVPAQIDANDDAAVEAFLAHHGRVVVKPVRGEQGQGVRVDLQWLDDMRAAIDAARRFSDHVIVEQMVSGDDLRIVVIDHRVVAAATRRPAEVVGDGRSSVRALIERQSRRRQLATAGESRIPIDDETGRCLAEQGYTLDGIPAAGTRVAVRKTANLHTGGTIHDVTPILHPGLRDAAERASRALEIPVVGFDFIVTAPDRPDYVIIEANERPGLANHEPQPTSERFIDLLFPQTVAANRDSGHGGANGA